MNRSTFSTFWTAAVLAAVLGLQAGAAEAHGYWRGPRVGVGIGFGVPVYAYPYGVYGAPVVVAPAPMVYAEPWQAPAPMAAPDPVFQPRQGQTASQIEADRQDCNRWAIGQPGAMPDARVFHRATLACMESKGYTVR